MARLNPPVEDSIKYDKREKAWVYTHGTKEWYLYDVKGRADAVKAALIAKSEIQDENRDRWIEREEQAEAVRRTILFCDDPEKNFRFVEDFFVAWKMCTGYGRQYPALPMIEAKSWIVNVLVQTAREKNWNYGWKVDEKAIKFPWVLYIDSPAGQLSFHGTPDVLSRIDLAQELGDIRDQMSAMRREKNYALTDEWLKDLRERYYKLKSLEEDVYKIKEFGYAPSQYDKEWDGSRDTAKRIGEIFGSVSPLRGATCGMYHDGLGLMYYGF